MGDLKFLNKSQKCVRSFNIKLGPVGAALVVPNQISWGFTVHSRLPSGPASAHWTVDKGSISVVSRECQSVDGGQATKSHVMIAKLYWQHDVMRNNVPSAVGSA